MNSAKQVILRQFKEKPNQYISGELLSKKLNVSRSAVWKNIEQLRQTGYEITACRNKGYLLVGEPDLLDIELLQAKGIYYVESVDSTNLAARQLAEEGADNFTVITAEEQLAGRGRHGRNWHSPKGKGLWFTVILRPEGVPPTGISSVTLVTAAVVADYLSANNIPVKVKWPNDLLIREKKTGGILTEFKGEPDRIDYLLVGIGLNVHHRTVDFPDQLKPLATSLGLEGEVKLKRTELLLAISGRLQQAYNLYFNEGFSLFQPLWKKYNVTLGREVKVKLPNGEIKGKAIDLNESGALLLQDESGTVQTISYGEII